MIEQLSYVEMIVLSLLSVPFIGFMDYLIFYKHLRCQFCGKDMGDWRQWMLPTFIEFLVFIAGISLGYFGKHGGYP